MSAFSPLCLSHAGCEDSSPSSRCRARQWADGGYSMHVSTYPTMHSASPGLLLLSFLFLADADCECSHVRKHIARFGSRVQPVQNSYVMNLARTKALSSDIASVLFKCVFICIAFGKRAWREASCFCPSRYYLARTVGPHMADQIISPQLVRLRWCGVCVCGRFACSCPTNMFGFCFGFFFAQPTSSLVSCMFPCSSIRMWCRRATSSCSSPSTKIILKFYNLHKTTVLFFFLYLSLLGSSFTYIWL